MLVLLRLCALLVVGKEMPKLNSVFCVKHFFCLIHESVFIYNNLGGFTTDKGANKELESLSLQCRQSSLHTPEAPKLHAQPLTKRIKTTSFRSQYIEAIESHLSFQNGCTSVQFQNK